MRYYLITGFFLLTNFISVNSQNITSVSFTDLYINADTGRMWFDRSSSFMDSAVANMQRQQQIQQMMLSSTMTGLMVESFMKENIGRQKVAAGKATTRFIALPQNSIVESIADKGNSLQEKQENKQMFNLSLQTFNNILKAKGMMPNDSADGYALAFFLSYIAYYDEDPGDIRLKTLARNFRQTELKDFVFQGTPDKEKQQTYENKAFQTMLAVRAYQLYKKPNLSLEQKKNAKDSAQNYALSVLKTMWETDPTKIALTKDGFGDKGEILVSKGNASTSFQRNKSVLTSYKYISDRYDYLEKDKTYFINLLNEFDDQVKKLNGSIDDAAWANVAAAFLAYEIYTDGKIRLNQQQIEWILKEKRSDILKDAAYQSYSDEEKQAYYETVALRVMVIYDDYKQALTNMNKYPMSSQTQKDNSIRFAGDVLREIFKPREFDEYKLMPNGFIKSGR